MYPAKPGFIIGFHGCDLKVRDKLVTGKTTLRSSNNSYDWLGNGIYFWENNQERALDFAGELKGKSASKSGIKIPAVVGAILDIGFCLDLLDAEYIALVKESHKTLEESCKKLGLPMPVNNNVGSSTDLLLRNLDCAVIQNLHLERERNDMRPFDSVRGAFIEGSPLYTNAGFHEKNHIQICVRNPNCIKGYFIPRPAVNGWQVP
jgi:hypothetical protein